MDQFILISHTVRCITSFRRVNTSRNTARTGIEVITIGVVGELLQSFILISIFCPLLSFLSSWWDNEKMHMQTEPSAEFWNVCSFLLFCFLVALFSPPLALHSFPSLGLTCRLITFTSLLVGFDTHVVDKIVCAHLWIRGGFCGVFPINTQMRIRHTCVSARYILTSPPSMKRRHYRRTDACFPRREETRRKTVLPLFKQLT